MEALASVLTARLAFRDLNLIRRSPCTVPTQLLPKPVCLKKPISSQLQPKESIKFRCDFIYRYLAEQRLWSPASTNIFLPLLQPPFDHASNTVLLNLHVHFVSRNGEKQQHAFKDTYPEELLAALIKDLLQRTELNPSLIQDVCIGNVLQPGAGAVSTRIGLLLGGLPASVPVHVVNRQCSSGLQAVAQIAASIKSGFIDVGLGGGVESMTHFDMLNALNPEKISEEVYSHETARNCLMPMGITSENVAKQYGVSREEQDAFACASHAKCIAAQKAGLFDEEIVPVKAKVKDRDGNEREVIVEKDEGARARTTVEILSKLPPSFETGGTTTAGNSSQVSDGAALVLLARRSVAEQLRLPISARFVSYAVAGVPPEVMGIGPVFAIPAALKKAHLRIEDIDIFELNEAFASQATYCVRELKIPREKLNPKGGAIALGHPLGCTGARQIATLLPELRRRKQRYGVVSMCVGTGMGAAAVIENLVR